MLKFEIQSKIAGKKGRVGTITTPHGNIQTPAFIPVATKATVKSLTPEQVASLGADAVLANTYHLYLEPGTEVLEKAGGLGKFMNWPGPTFTDSGGFQAFSLGPAYGKRLGKIGGKDDEVKDNGTDEKSQIDEAFATRPAKIDDDGVTFKSVIDGSTHRFTPEKSIEIQHSIGADIIFAFDECLSPQESYDKQKAAVERTHSWAKRCITVHHKAEPGDEDFLDTPSDSAESAAGSPSPSLGPKRPKNLSPGSALFGIIQGGRYEDLRRYSAKTIGSMDFDGFGIGGSFDKEDIGTAVGWVCEELPENKPRHLLGIGEPEDLILGIENGIDTFDCVAPTRIARNGAAYVRNLSEARPSLVRSRINLLNAKFISDFSPIMKDCGCYTCKNYTKAYLAHLFRAKEMLAATLVSIHNLYFVVNLVKEARNSIIKGKWDEFRNNYL